MRQSAESFIPYLIKDDEVGALISQNMIKYEKKLYAIKSNEFNLVSLLIFTHKEVYSL